MPRMKVAKIKNEIQEVDDDDGTPPPMLEAETDLSYPQLDKLENDDAEEQGTFEDQGVSSTASQTLLEILNAQLIKDDKETSPVSDSEPPPKLSISNRPESSPSMLPGPSTSSVAPKTFRDVVRIGYVNPTKNQKTRLTLKRGSPSVVPPSLPPKRSLRSSNNNFGLTQLLQNQEPIRVDVQVGNGSPPCSSNSSQIVRGTKPNYTALHGQTSSSSNERGEGSAIESSPSPSNNCNGSVGLFDAEAAKDAFKTVLNPETIMKEASTHTLLLGCMVMNAVSTLEKRRGKCHSDSLRRDIYNLMDKYKIH